MSGCLQTSQRVGGRARGPSSSDSMAILEIVKNNFFRGHVSISWDRWTIDHLLADRHQTIRAEPWDFCIGESLCKFFSFFFFFDVSLAADLQSGSLLFSVRRRTMLRRTRRNAKKNDFKWKVEGRGKENGKGKGRERFTFHFLFSFLSPFHLTL